MSKVLLGSQAIVHELAAQVAVNGLSLGLLSKYVLTLKFFDDDPPAIMFSSDHTRQTNMLIKATSAASNQAGARAEAAAITKE
eukprot:tig00000319_g24117.t1